MVPVTEVGGPREMGSKAGLDQAQGSAGECFRWADKRHPKESWNGTMCGECPIFRTSVGTDEKVTNRFALRRRTGTGDRTGRTVPVN